MLTKVAVYDPSGRITDSLHLPIRFDVVIINDIAHITNIDGLSPVKASVNTSPYGSIDGASYNGSTISDRNIVLDILPKPDWVDWDITAIRNYIYKYFMPKSYRRLVFESTDKPPVEIYGYVESCEPNIFSKDNKIQVSIVCPDPHFKSIDPVVINGQTSDVALDINYIGTMDTGIHVEIFSNSGPDPLTLNISLENTMDDTIAANFTDLDIGPVVDLGKKFVVNTVPGDKYVRNVTIPGEIITNRLGMGISMTRWLRLEPGLNSFDVHSASGEQDWTLTYYNHFGGL